MTEFSKSRLAKNLLKPEYKGYNYIAVDSDRQIVATSHRVWRVMESWNYKSICTGYEKVAELPENIDFNWKETLCSREDIETVVICNKCGGNNWGVLDYTDETKECIECGYLKRIGEPTQDKGLHPQDVFEYLHLSDMWMKIKTGIVGAAVLVGRNQDEIYVNELFNINIDMSYFEQQAVWERPVDHSKNIGKIGWFGNFGDANQMDCIGFLRGISETGVFEYGRTKSDMHNLYAKHFRLLTEAEKEEMF